MRAQPITFAMISACKTEAVLIIYRKVVVACKTTLTKTPNTVANEMAKMAERWN